MVEKVGKRAMQKRERLAAIRTAATGLFQSDGFDATTTRGIAEAAGIPLATLFTYASDKRDILFLCVIDELEALTHGAFATVPNGMPLLDRLVYIFDHYYGYFDRNMEIGRMVLREMFFAANGPSATRLAVDRAFILDELAALIARAREDGEIRARTDNARCARAVFAIYSAEIRRWIADGPERNVTLGVLELRQLLRLVVRGMCTPDREEASLSQAALPPAPRAHALAGLHHPERAGRTD